ncbi:cell wall hydrolase [Roseospira navarrensis]|uniref:Cell wall hydrolase n=1 Tax=Roseospira navarrensis TaxID=140058 RepID=A0A7X1ZFN6_9PROT|nr:cell wall hydrolase [Roseospira navarrensis]MQX37458.1 cell wall hydrolase [Roseospira navarrensis]
MDATRRPVRRILGGLPALLLAVLLVAGGLVPRAQALAPGADIPADIRIDWANMVVPRDELICLALNDYWEARGESTRGRVAVAQVVLNRARDPRFPASICGVVTENRSTKPRLCQFSWNCDGRSDTPHEAAAWRASVLLAKSLLMRNNAISDLTGGALWYHNRHVDPGWSGRLEFATRVGDHYFYREAGPRVQQAGAPPMTFADWTDEQARTQTGEDGDQLARSEDR